MFDTSNDQPTIQAERFVLRPLRRSDAGLIGLYAADKRMAEMTRQIPHPLPPGAVEATIENALDPERKEDVWAIDGQATGLAEVVGLVHLARLDRQQSEISYWIAPQLWNAGLATEAVRALLAANPHGSRECFAEVFQDNLRSARVLTNCGFSYLGDAEAWSVSRGAMVPTWTYMAKM
ncbi:GNAT family N-acetyltransferase [Histidinibacterium aquaticum]|uniref:GNAT family N-acetyltransferase n=1 Tax=Histidinibacterium aquaticum TaxID=2613962 RepID=A0A5J5GN59_9RHOB|nr:GNAT family N-acetyltransferase [Histidinibacterium aquaticum]KAA9008882.1 GNAT family N-acetyltransferase [Histidinibacterium aquaticum]